jgi:tRNA(fMet)-specific endonuclease VapC
MAGISFLLDTNIISEAARIDPHPKVKARLRQQLAASAIAAPTWFEMKTGIARLPKSKKRRNLEGFLRNLRRAGVPVLPYNEEAAAWHAAEHARLAALGNPRPVIDAQIAAIAATNKLVMVTRNSRDFVLFVDLRLENWFD